MYLDFLRFYIKAKNAHGLHSPFIFDFYTNVYRNIDKNSDFLKIEKLRGQLLNSAKEISVIDLGAGSNGKKESVRKIKNIARGSLKSPKWAQFFHSIIKYYHCSHILELGTSLGITTSYLALASPHGKVFSLEGCPNILSVAKQNFSQLNLNHIVSVSGNIDLTLNKVLDKIKRLDFVLFDANHRLSPTLDYFEQCVKLAHQDSIFVFDDIYWSEDMKTAWETIHSDSRVSLSIDFFYVGIVFFRKGVEKQHFYLY